MQFVPQHVDREGRKTPLTQLRDSHVQPKMHAVNYSQIFSGASRWSAPGAAAAAASSLSDLKGSKEWALSLSPLLPFAALCKHPYAATEPPKAGGGGPEKLNPMSRIVPFAALAVRERGKTHTGSPVRSYSFLFYSKDHISFLD